MLSLLFLFLMRFQGCALGDDEVREELELTAELGVVLLEAEDNLGTAANGLNIVGVDDEGTSVQNALDHDIKSEHAHARLHCCEE